MTSERMTEFEHRLALALRAYVDHAELHAEARDVRREMRQVRRFRWVPALAAVVTVAAVVAVGFATLFLPMGSRGSEARVNGMTYSISIARSLELNAADITPIGEIEPEQRELFADLTAYAMDGVDPADALAVRAAPDQRDDAGSLGDWILLTRGEIRGGDPSPLCPYFDPNSDYSPEECQEDAQ